MTAMFEMSIPSETLSVEELQQITGCGRRSDQVTWLDAQGWTYVKNRAGDPVVGRMYTRLRLAGIAPAAVISPTGWVPDFNAVR